MEAMSRRAFAEQLALAAAAPFLLDEISPLVPLAPTGRGGEGVRDQSDPSPLAQTLAEAVRLRYPDRFSDEQLAAITRSIDGRLRQVERLYQTELTNADEPDFVYTVYRGADA
ncbi:MAG: hypothetical protein ACRDKX_05600 [Solirubrobacterales bacterium]